MKTRNILLLAAFCILLIGGCTSYNGLVEKQETVNTAWSQVENVYQRRSDLIPNLVSTVKGYATFEKSTLVDVINARAAATQTKIDASNLTPENFQKFQQSQDGLSSALSKLMVVVEKYPDLKANQNFLELQSQLEGTENRIAVERKKFNITVKTYNVAVRAFPRNLLANMFSFNTKPYFESDKGAEKAPEVKF